MYSLLKNIQILVALLKEKGVHHAVISPGGCSIPVVRSMEDDPDFTCYSVVDERSAAYFALGISQSLRKPVAVVCTSGTAVCNYMSGVAEAFHQGVPLIMITADRHPYLYGQMETQKLNQDGIFGDLCVKSVSLPVVHDDNDFWYCERLVNEALLELDHHGSGPVHINIPTGVLGLPNDCKVKELPAVNLISRVMESDSDDMWKKRVEELKLYKRILVVFGQDRPYPQEVVDSIEEFGKKYNCVLSVEHLSNLQCEGTVYTYPVTETASLSGFTELLPDLVISVGYNIAGADIKYHMRSNRGKFTHWLIDERGNVKDVFKGLSVIFECSTAEFFKRFTEEGAGECRNDHHYYNEWVEAVNSIKPADFPFSNIYVAQEFAKCVPANSILHLSILNSTRHMQFFKINKDIEVYSNVGALGIDGSMSTFLGQSTATEKLSFLLIGDLSFFYDMNSVWIRHVGKNVRILMVNNGGGGEFLFRPGIKQYPKIQDHIGVRHGASPKDWVESLGFKYLTASTKDELEGALEQFIVPGDGPVFLEAFSDTEVDAEISQNFYADNRREGSAEKSKARVKGLAKNVLGEKTAGKAAKILKTIRE